MEKLLAALLWIAGVFYLARALRTFSELNNRPQLAERELRSTSFEARSFGFYSWLLPRLMLDL